jgi:uncharacterized protein (DUF342 family)
VDYDNVCILVGRLFIESQAKLNQLTNQLHEREIRIKSLEDELVKLRRLVLELDNDATGEGT